MTQNCIGGPDKVTLYSEVVSSRLPPSFKTMQNTDLLKLKQALRELMADHSEGVSLTKARRFCPLLFEPKVLNGYASVRQLLESMPDVVRLEGLGVQTYLLPTATTS